MFTLQVLNDASGLTQVLMAVSESLRKFSVRLHEVTNNLMKSSAVDWICQKCIFVFLFYFFIVFFQERRIIWNVLFSLSVLTLEMDKEENTVVMHSYDFAYTHTHVMDQVVLKTRVGAKCAQRVWVSLRARARLDFLTRSPPESSTHIMAITGSLWEHKVKAPTLMAH